MAVLRITGYNRHPSLIDILKDDVLPSLEKDHRLQIASVPCATGVETLALAIEFERLGLDFAISGFDIDPLAIKAAKSGLYTLHPFTGKINGDTISGFDYQWCNLTPNDRERFFEERNDGEARHIRVVERIKRKVTYFLQGIEELPPNKFDIIVCLNFLRYLIDERYQTGLPRLDTVSRRLFDATRSLGALLIDPKAAKSEAIDISLRVNGYHRLASNAYVKP